MYLGSADKFDRDNAKLMLSAYRPNGADAQDPVFKEALELAQRDPELARWFRGERDFDQMISSKLRLIEPPVVLEAAILAGLRTTSIPRYGFIYWPAIVAALVPWVIASLADGVETFLRRRIDLSHSTRLH